MSQVGNSASRFGGEYMIQDSDHMSEVGQKKDKASRGNDRQTDQSQASSRQQGSFDQGEQAQQGGRRRQAH